MRRLVNILVPLAVMVAWSCLAAAADDLMYYRGYFNGQVVEQPPVGFVYRANLSTLQPAFYYQYGTLPVQLPSAPATTAPWAQPSAGSALEVGDATESSSEAALFSRQPLPGQYWYNQPGVWAFHTLDLGWPYGPRR